MEASGRNTSFGAAVCCSLLSMLAMTGCGSRDYMEMYDLPSSGWGADKSVVFTFIPDSASIPLPSSQGEWIDITVRHSGDFPYADLPLEIKGVMPDKQFWVDTVDFALGVRDTDGAFQWAGQRYSNHYDITRRYRSGIRYRRFDTIPAEYAISVRQLTGENPLHGVLSIGIIASGAHQVQPR